MSEVTRRRAIYTGLSKYLPEADLLPILSFWEANYAQRPAFALNEFLGEVAKRSSHKLERANLYRELISIMQGPASGLLPDPVEQLEAWRRGAGANAEEVSSPDVQARQTFEALSTQLFAAVPEAQLFAFRRLVSSKLMELSDKSELRLRLRAWLEQGKGFSRIALDVEQLRMLLSLIYGGLCEHFGPVHTDRLLSQAVREIEKMDLPFPPQKLL